MFSRLYGYLLLILASQVANVLLQNVANSALIRMASRESGGVLDVVYQKMLLLSDGARQTTASGNVTNLLFTDTQKIAQMLLYLAMILQVPVDLAVYVLYLGLAISPLALSGLAVFALFVPLLWGVMQRVMRLQRQIMGMADLRMKRAGEVLNGIKVVKLFGLERVQQARLQNAREKEVKTLLAFSRCFALFQIVSVGAAPLMTSLVFLLLNLINRFDISEAFTIMFLFQYLGFAIIMLPMVLTMVSEAFISSTRINAFLGLGERDPGVLVRVDLLTAQ